jgi:WD40 repeat protein
MKERRYIAILGILAVLLQTMWSIPADARTTYHLAHRVRGFEWILGMAWSPDGSHIATLGTHSNPAGWRSTLSIEIWDSKTGLLGVTPYDHEEPESWVSASPFQSISWSANGAYLAACIPDNVSIWNPDDGKELYTLETSWFLVSGPILAFGPDSKSLAVTSSDGTMQLWSTESGKIVSKLSLKLGGEPGTEAPRTLAWSPDGKQIALGMGPASAVAVVIDSVSGKTLLRTKSTGLRTTSTVWTPKGDGLVIVDNYTRANFWDIKTGQKQKEVYVGGSITSISADNRLIAANDEPGELGNPEDIARIWNLETGKVVTVLPHDDHVYLLAFSPDSKRLAAASGDSLYIWERE